MEDVTTKSLGEILDNFLDELQLKMDDFIDNLSNLHKKTSVNESNNTLTTSELDVYDFSRIKITETQFVEIIRDILVHAQHKVVVITPTITDLEDLEVYNVRSSINLNIGCFIDIENDRHVELLEELESFSQIRNLEVKGIANKKKTAAIKAAEKACDLLYLSYNII